MKARTHFLFTVPLVILLVLMSLLPASPVRALEESVLPTGVARLGAKSGMRTQMSDDGHCVSQVFHGTYTFRRSCAVTRCRKARTSASVTSKSKCFHSPPRATVFWGC